MSVAGRALAGFKRRFLQERPRGASLEHDVREFLDVQTVRTVIDVGANAGQSAKLFYRLFPQAQIFSIEPVEGVFRELQANTRRWPRVRCIRGALGEAERDVLINTFEITQLASINCTENSTGTERVRMETLTGLMARLGLCRVDFLKVDVEGYELQVLAGARELLESGGIPLILVEAGVDGSNERFTPTWQIRDELGRYGYEIYGFYDQSSWEQHGSLLYVNVLFVSPTVLAERRVSQTRRIGVSVSEYRQFSR